MTDTIELSEVQFSDQTLLTGRSSNSVNRRECEVMRFDDGFVVIKRRIKARARGGKVQRIPLHNVKSMTYLADDPEAQEWEAKQQKEAEREAKKHAAQEAKKQGTAPAAKPKGGRGKRSKPAPAQNDSATAAGKPDSSTEARRG